MDCRTGKTLNPHTCVYVKECPTGFIRNDRFLCRKDPNIRKERTRKERTQKEKTQTKKLKSKPNSSKPKKMFDEDTVFVFYSKSAPSKPGQGKNEKIPEEKKEMYEELAAIPDWRKKLSNFWIQPFELDNLHWSSVEHYYQASKFRKKNPAFYKQFAIESGTELSKNPVLAKSTGGKDVKHKYRPKEIQVDPDFFEGRAQKEMYMAQSVKFAHKDLRDMLKATKMAKLEHYTRGGHLETFISLMDIRRKI